MAATAAEARPRPRAGDADAPGRPARRRPNRRRPRRVAATADQSARTPPGWAAPGSPARQTGRLGVGRQRPRVKASAGIGRQRQQGRLRLQRPPSACGRWNSASASGRISFQHQPVRPAMSSPTRAPGSRHRPQTGGMPCPHTLTRSSAVRPTLGARPYRLVRRSVGAGTHQSTAARAPSAVQPRTPRDPVHEFGTCTSATSPAALAAATSVDCCVDTTRDTTVPPALDGSACALNTRAVATSTTACGAALRPLFRSPLRSSVAAE